MLIGLGVFCDPAWGDLIGGLWLIFIGLFLGQAARGAAYQTARALQDRGRAGRGRDGRRAGRDPSDMTIEQALHEYFLRYR